MFNLGSEIFNITMVGITLGIVNKFLGIFFEKKQRKLYSYIPWMAFTIFQLFVEYNKGIASIWTTIISIILVFLISVFNFQKSTKSKLFIAILLYAVWTLIEMLVFYCMSVFSIGKDTFAILGSVISKILVIISIYLFSVFWKEKDNEQIPAKYYFILLFIPLGSICIAVDKFFSVENNDGILSSMIVFSILLLFNIIVFEIYSKLAEKFILEKEKTVYEQQINIMTRSTEEQKEIMEEFREERHNLVNELIVLRNSAENDDNINVIDSLNHIIKGFVVSEKIANSGNNVVDAIINFKYTIADKEHIKFNLKIFIPEELPFHQCDIGIILGNAIDNAIEAVKNCASDKRNIDISMGIKKEALILTVKNYYEHSLRKDKKGNLLSTKKHYNRHGYGVKSIKRVAEQYHGEVLVETENNEFVLTVIMNIEQD